MEELIANLEVATTDVRTQLAKERARHDAFADSVAALLA
jgi:hypothetical protein